MAGFKVELHISGMTCASCVATLQNHLRKLPGVSNPVVNLILERATLRLDTSQMELERLCEEIDDIGFTGSLLSVQDEAVQDSTSLSPVDNTLRSIASSPHSYPSSKIVPGFIALTPERNTTSADSNVNADTSVSTKCPSSGQESPILDRRLPFPVSGRNDPRTIKLKQKQSGTATLSVLVSTIDSTKSERRWWTLFLNARAYPASVSIRELTKASRALSEIGGVISCLPATNSKLGGSLSVIYNPHTIGSRIIMKKLYEMLPTYQLLATITDQAQEKLYLEYFSARSRFLKCVFAALVVAWLAMSPHHRLPNFLQHFVAPGLSVCSIIMIFLTTPIHFWGGWAFHVRAWKAIRNKYYTMDLLVSISTNLTYFYSVASIMYTYVIGKTHQGSVLGAGILVAEHGSGALKADDLLQGAVVPHFFETPAILITSLLLGKLVEARVKVLSSRAVHRLQNMNCDRCLVLHSDSNIVPLPTNDVRVDEDARLLAIPHTTYLSVEKPLSFYNMYPSGTELSSALLHIGDIVLANPGVSVPADGIVENCSSVLFVDESIATGESYPVAKNKGDYIIGGSKVISGSLYLRITEIGSQTFLGQVQSLVDTANESKSPAQVVADKVSQYFVPAALFLAALTAFVWTFLVYFTNIAASTKLNRIVFISQFPVAVIAVACPCALGLATPTAVALATGCAARFGILIKNFEIMEEASQKMTDIIFDKTGTLTTGQMRITSVGTISNVGEWPKLLADLVRSLQNNKNIKNTLTHTTPGPSQLLFNHQLSDHYYLNQLLGILHAQNIVISNPLSSIETLSIILWAAASLQQQTNHPIGRAVVEFYCRYLRISNNGNGFENKGFLPELSDPFDFNVISGEGIWGILDLAPWQEYCHGSLMLSEVNRKIHVVMGNAKMMQRVVLNPLTAPSCGSNSNDNNNNNNNVAETLTYIAIESQLIGTLGLGDQPKPDAARIISTLKDEYQSTVWMCTGDAQSAAYHIGDAVGIPKSNICYEATPENKAEFVKHVIQLPLTTTKKHQKRNVVMIGDGINDAPSLASATVGVAIGARNQITVSAADVILVRSSLGDFMGFLELSKKTVQIIRYNYIWAFLFNAIGIPVAAGIFYPNLMLPPAIAGILMALSSIVVVMNSLLLTLFKPSRCFNPLDLDIVVSHTDQSPSNTTASKQRSCNYSLIVPSRHDETELLTPKPNTLNFDFDDNNTTSLKNL